MFKTAGASATYMGVDDRTWEARIRSIVQQNNSEDGASSPGSPKVETPPFKIQSERIEKTAAPTEAKHDTDGDHSLEEGEMNEGQEIERLEEP